MLLLTALIWGFAFVAQQTGAMEMGPFTFNGIRNLLGSLVLAPVILLMQKTGRIRKAFTREALAGGLCCGLCLFFASSLQQLGIMQTSVGKAGFITAMYIVIVPVLGVFTGRRPGLKVWLAVAVAVAGMYLLCINEGLSIGKGDLLVLAGSFVFSLHILTIDRFSRQADGLVLSCLQFLVTGVLSAACMCLFEDPSEVPRTLPAARYAILYSGIMSCGVAYTLQMLYQKDVEPAAASLILSLEAVFSVIGGWLLLGQGLTLREMLGCVLMFAAIVLAQV